METNYTMETRTMESSTIKKVGTREDVYKGLASRTAGGLTKNDIIEKNFNGKLIYISKKISDKMRAQMSAIHSLANSNNSNTNHQTDNTITTQQLQEYNKHKKILKKNKKTLAALKTNTMNTTNTANNTNLINNNNNNNKHKSKTQKLSFQVTNNEVKNVYYPELKGLDLKELKADLLREEQEEDYPDLEPKDDNTNKVKKPLEPFTIDELPDIDINFL